MRSIVTSILLLTLFTPLSSQSLLVMTKTNGYRHASIDAGKEMLAHIVNDRSYTIRYIEDSTYINTKNLQEVDVLVFLNTSGNILNNSGQEALQTYVQNGGGFLGIHCASCTEYDWPWYEKLVGRHFQDHPPVQKATLQIDSTSSMTNHLNAVWTKTDEWYNFKTPFPQNLHSIMWVDEDTYQGGTMGQSHPITWYHEFDGGRSFYTALGHTDETYSDPRFIQMIDKAILWLID